jgi:hypothetical protein
MLGMEKSSCNYFGWNFPICEVYKDYFLFLGLHSVALSTAKDL